MSDDGTVESHINNVAESAKSMSSWILRTSKMRAKDALLLPWKSTTPTTKVLISPMVSAESHEHSKI